MILRVLNSLQWFENLSNNMKLRVARAFVPETFETGSSCLSFPFPSSIAYFFILLLWFFPFVEFLLINTNAIPLSFFFISFVLYFFLTCFLLLRIPLVISSFPSFSFIHWIRNSSLFPLNNRIFFCLFLLDSSIYLTVYPSMHLPMYLSIYQFKSSHFSNNRSIRPIRHFDFCLFLNFDES